MAMLLWTFDIDLISFVLVPYLVKSFQSKDLVNSMNRLNGKEKERLIRIRELMAILVVDLIYHLIIHR